MADWELLLLERAKQRDQPCISDLLELYGSYTELKKRFMSAQLCSLSSPQNSSPTCSKEANSTRQQVQVLQEKLLQLQKKLTNSYRSKLSLDDSISQLHGKIEKLENEVLEKDKTISRLERTIAYLQSRNA